MKKKKAQVCAHIRFFSDFSLLYNLGNRLLSFTFNSGKFAETSNLIIDLSDTTACLFARCKAALAVWSSVFSQSAPANISSSALAASGPWERIILGADFR